MTVNVTATFPLNAKRTLDASESREVGSRKNGFIVAAALRVAMRLQSCNQRNAILAQR
jgi:hypothetical protein